jgi:hypothetical protein
LFLCAQVTRGYFTGITITSRHQAGIGLHSAILQAAKPTAPGI